MLRREALGHGVQEADLAEAELAPRPDAEDSHGAAACLWQRAVRGKEPAPARVERDLRAVRNGGEILCSEHCSVRPASNARGGGGGGGGGSGGVCVVRVWCCLTLGTVDSVSTCVRRPVLVSMR